MLRLVDNTELDTTRSIFTHARTHKSTWKTGSTYTLEFGATDKARIVKTEHVAEEEVVAVGPAGKRSLLTSAVSPHERKSGRHVEFGVHHCKNWR